MENQQDQKNYWKSIDEKYNTPEYQAQLEHEFQSSPLKEMDDKSGLARRQFMKLMGASVALSTAACVRRPVQKIIPYNKRPSEVVIGIPNYYASSFQIDGEGFPVTIKTREGRPLHIEGVDGGVLGRRGLSTRASAQILNLYDPDRIRKPTINSQDPKKRGNKISVPRDWDSLDKKVVAQMKKGGVRFLLKGSASPSLNAFVEKFAKSFSVGVHRWETLNMGTIRNGQKSCYGTALVPRYQLDKAKYIVSVDSDFLGTALNPTENAVGFHKSRNPESGEMSKLVSFYSVPSLTSFNSDDSYSIQPSHQLPLVLGMLHELLFVQQKSKFSGNAGIQAVTEPHEKIYLGLGMSHDDFAKIVSGLYEARGNSLVSAGSLVTKTKHGEDLQVAVNLLNSALENDGYTVLHQDPIVGHSGDDKDLHRLIADIEGGSVKTLVMDEVNPAFSLPDSQKFKAMLAKVEMVVSLSNWMDETASLSDVVAPQGHVLENWGDLEIRKGIVTVQQPTIQPLYDTRSFADSLMAWASQLGTPLTDAEDFFSYFKKTWVAKLGSEQQWFDFLQKGTTGGATTFGQTLRNFDLTAFTKIQVPPVKGGDESIEMALYAKVGLGDGSMGNVSWLQELPDPVSKIAWDNYLHISPKRAKTLGVGFGDMVSVAFGDAVKMKLPVFVSPGTNDNTVAIAIGYGRTAGGDIVEKVGFDVSPFAQWHDGALVYAGENVSVTKVEGVYPLAQTQGHHNLEGRQIVGEGTLKFYKGHGNVGLHKHPTFSIWNKHSYDGHKWGMGVDLSSCNGCSACMISCQSENNIPVVGKKFILHGREMHWIRIDRYFNGNEEQNPDTVFQPIMCQHCENAPCETVCPVLATVHSDEGLNDMVYNRCVGTRYCSNNCPYKVRRFNWFQYDSHHKKEPLHMALNPDVTVRTKGVMEKCTFCVQRIKEQKNIAKDEKRALKDGDIKTACESACPTEAIVFGDLNDPKSRVSQWFESAREYTLLEEFNAAPRVRYLAKIRNTDRLLSTSHHEASPDAGDHGVESDGHGNKGGH